MELEPFIVYTKASTAEQALTEARRVFNINKGLVQWVRLPKGQHGYQYALSLITERDARFIGPWAPVGIIHEPPGYYLFGYHRPDEA